MSETTPLVSVLTLAYNHAPYIRECLEKNYKNKIYCNKCSTDGRY